MTNLESQELSGVSVCLAFYHFFGCTFTDIKITKVVLLGKNVFLVLNLIFPPSRFSLLSSGRSLCYLPHIAPTASRKKNKQPKIFFRAQCETLRVD